RAVAALIGSILGLVLLAPAASAAAPVQIRVSDPVSFELPGGEFCEFDVQVDIEQKFKVILFAGHRGTWIGGLTAGKIVAVLSSGDATVRLSIPGPGFLDVEGNLVRGTGPWLIFFPGEVLLVTGHMGFVGTPPQVEPVNVRGRIVDLCEVLAEP
ncbi:MAG TPA: hypothetical protein VF108_04670, partial [Actinomycetota bacterium]